MDRLEVGSSPFDAFRGRSVFVTGHTGFKGSWLSVWLSQLGARVTGYALAAASTPNGFDVSGARGALCAHHEADIRDARRLGDVLQAAEPDVIFHLAAQSLVRQGHQTPRDTFDVNAIGTACLLDAVRQLQRPCVVLAITSDKCYADPGSPQGCRETDPLGGDEPYSASKAAAELVTAAYRTSYFPPEEIDRHGVQLATARAGNVIGGGDWAQDRIVPDIVAALSDDRPVRLRNPHAVRPWQHVLDSLSGYLLLAQLMLRTEALELSSAWNFGPSRASISVRELVETFIRQWGRGSWQDDSQGRQPLEAPALVLNADRARSQLGWEPVWDLEKTVSRTASWYERFYRRREGSYLEDIAAWQADWHAAHSQQWAYV